MASSSTFELNDTLQITKEQGFPWELSLETHLITPISFDEVMGKIFCFHNKSGLRNFVAYPVRVFLVENRDGKWVYWWLCQILETTIDYVKRETSGKFQILKIFTPDEMKKVFPLIHTRPEENYFL